MDIRDAKSSRKERNQPAITPPPPSNNRFQKVSRVCVVVVWLRTLMLWGSQHGTAATPGGVRDGRQYAPPTSLSPPPPPSLPPPPPPPLAPRLRQHRIEMGTKVRGAVTVLGPRSRSRHGGDDEDDVIAAACQLATELVHGARVGVHAMRVAQLRRRGGGRDGTGQHLKHAIVLVPVHTRAHPPRAETRVSRSLERRRGLPPQVHVLHDSVGRVAVRHRPHAPQRQQNVRRRHHAQRLWVLGSGGGGASARVCYDMRARLLRFVFFG